MSRVIFLDIDGVVTSARSAWYNFDPFVISFLRHLCKEGHIHIVISSTWRYHYKKDFWQTLFENYLHEDHETPYLLSKKLSQRACRGDEIQEWLNKHPDVTKYLILDDDSDMLDNQKPSFRRTDSINGMLFDDMVFMMDYFNVKVGSNIEIHQHPNLYEKTRHEYEVKKDNKINFT